MNDVLTKQKFKKRIWNKWWFWIILVILSIGVWQARIALEWRGDSALQRLQEQGMQEYAAKQEKDLKDTVIMLKADTYGGATPEETLELFIAALEQEDAALASKYYLPWKQEEAKKDLEDWIRNFNEGLNIFVTASKEGIMKKDESYVVGVSLDIYKSVSDTIPYVIKMEQNQETKLWKISEF